MTAINLTGVTAGGNELTPERNLSDTHDLIPQGYDITAEKIAKGYYSKVYAAPSPDEAEGNTGIILRDGSYQVATDGEYRDDDIITLPGGFQVTMEIAKQQGIIDANGHIINGMSEADGPIVDASGDVHHDDDEPYTGQPSPDAPVALPQDVENLHLAFEMQLGEGEGISTFGKLAAEYIDTGELSQATQEGVARRLGMGPDQAQRLAADSVASLTTSAAEALGGGDEGAERVAFLSHAMHHGDAKTGGYPVAPTIHPSLKPVMQTPRRSPATA